MRSSCHSSLVELSGICHQQTATTSVVWDNLCNSVLLCTTHLWDGGEIMPIFRKKSPILKEQKMTCLSGLEQWIKWQVCYVNNNNKERQTSFQMCFPFNKLIHDWVISEPRWQMTKDEREWSKDLIKPHHGMSYCDSGDQNRGDCVCSVQLWIISTLFLLWPTWGSVRSSTSGRLLSVSSAGDDLGHTNLFVHLLRFIMMVIFTFESNQHFASFPQNALTQCGLPWIRIPNGSAFTWNSL